MKVMQLKHLNLTTSDVSGLAAFFERFFAFHRVLERGSGAFTILNNDEDFVLTLMKAKQHDPVGYPETFHVGFYPGCGAQQARRIGRGRSCFTLIVQSAQTSQPCHIVWRKERRIGVAFD
jgi:hypothetical protein